LSILCFRLCDILLPSGVINDDYLSNQYLVVVVVVVVVVADNNDDDDDDDDDAELSANIT